MPLLSKLPIGNNLDQRKVKHSQSISTQDHQQKNSFFVQPRLSSSNKDLLSMFTSLQINGSYLFQWKILQFEIFTVLRKQMSVVLCQRASINSKKILISIFRKKLDPSAISEPRTSFFG